MKTCPQCHTTYTDDTLQFCLQDGNSLKIVNDNKTLVLDNESFSNQETVADNIANDTEVFDYKPTSSNQNATNKQVIDERAAETLVRQSSSIETQNQVVQEETPSKQGGFGLFTGFLIGVFLIAIGGISILAIVFLPSLLANKPIANSNTRNSDKTEKKERLLNDTDSVKVSASSSRNPEAGNFYSPKLAFDGNSRTAWAEGANGPGIGQWIAFDFDREITLKKIIIEPGYFKTKELWQQNNRLSVASFQFSDGVSKNVNFPDEMKVQQIDAGKVKTKSVMISIGDIYRGQFDAKDTLISEVKFIIEED